MHAHVANPLAEFVHNDPEVMSGTTVFRGTRVPARTLLDCYRVGQTLEEFLADFPSVSKEQAVGLLNALKTVLDDHARPA